MPPVCWSFGGCRGVWWGWQADLTSLEVPGRAEKYDTEGNVPSERTGMEVSGLAQSPYFLSGRLAT